MMFTRNALRGAVKATRIKHVRALSMASIDPSAIEITRTTSPKTKLPNEELTFGSTFSDHMLEIDWDVETGWDTPRSSPTALSKSILRPQVCITVCSALKE